LLEQLIILDDVSIGLDCKWLALLCTTQTVSLRHRIRFAPARRTTFYIALPLLLMAVEIRGISAADAFPRKSGTGTVLAPRVAHLPHDKQTVDSKCKAYGIGYAFADADSREINRSGYSSRFLGPITARTRLAATALNVRCQVGAKSVPTDPGFTWV
jgi:hypothetical protein